MGCVNDITERRALEEEREQFFEVALDLLCVADLDAGFLRVSRSFELTLGWTREELLGRPFLDLVHPEDLAATDEALRHLAEGHTTAGFEARYRCKDGSWRWLAWRAPPPAPGSRVLHAVARDVSAQKRESERLVRMAESDPLTGAANRSRLQQAVLDAIACSERSGTAFAVLFADPGPVQGAQRPPRSRRGRQGPPGGRPAVAPARAGERRRGPCRGRRVRVVLEGVKSRQAAEEVAVKLIRALGEPMQTVPSAPRVGVSIGVALWPEDGSSAATLLQLADRAMYQMKRAPTGVAAGAA